jgi:hypothetical protein
MCNKFFILIGVIQMNAIVNNVTIPASFNSFKELAQAPATIGVNAEKRISLFDAICTRYESTLNGEVKFHTANGVKVQTALDFIRDLTKPEEVSCFKSESRTWNDMSEETKDTNIKYLLTSQEYFNANAVITPDVAVFKAAIADLTGTVTLQDVITLFNSTGIKTLPADKQTIYEHFVAREEKLNVLVAAGISFTGNYAYEKAGLVHYKGSISPADLATNKAAILAATGSMVASFDVDSGNVVLDVTLKNVESSTQVEQPVTQGKGNKGK